MEYKLLHTCIRVLDLEKSLRFYDEALNFKETRRIDSKEGKFTLVFLSDSLKNHEIELTYNYDRDKPYDIGSGFGHLAVEVEDLELSRKKHMEKGYEVTDLMGLPGEKPKYYFLTDPDGYKIEILRA